MTDTGFLIFAAFGGGRIGRISQSTFFDRFIVKKIQITGMGKYAFECGFLHHIAGTKEKAQEMRIRYFPCAFLLFKNFSTFFLKAQQIAAAWVATVRKGG